jgi:ParB/RepB/Spo0J family partition protein
MSDRTNKSGSRNSFSFESHLGCEHEPEGNSETESDRQGFGSPTGNSAIETSTVAVTLIDKIRTRLDKRIAERLRVKAENSGPQGEDRSKVILKNELILLEDVRDDPEFVNCRLKAEEQELSELQSSMQQQGLHMPIKVIEAPGGGYYLRAGFRRFVAATRLKWKAIPAIVLLKNTPVEDEYWSNIIENSSRAALSTYEVALATKTMRDKFKVSPRDFALKAGYSESYIINLLRCIDRLPPEIIKSWKEKAPIPVSQYLTWSILTHDEARAQFEVYIGKKPNWEEVSSGKKTKNLLKVATDYGLKRMQKVRFAAQVAKGIDEKSRKQILDVIDFCMGARDHVPDIYDPNRRTRVY